MLTRGKKKNRGQRARRALWNRLVAIQQGRDYTVVEPATTSQPPSAARASDNGWVCPLVDPQYYDRYHGEYFDYSILHTNASDTWRIESQISDTSTDGTYVMYQALVHVQTRNCVRHATIGVFFDDEPDYPSPLQFAHDENSDLASWTATFDVRWPAAIKTKQSATWMLPMSTAPHRQWSEAIALQTLLPITLARLVVCLLAGAPFVPADNHDLIHETKGFTRIKHGYEHYPELPI
jgi:hypothetical protein